MRRTGLGAAAAVGAFVGGLTGALTGVVTAGLLDYNDQVKWITDNTGPNSTNPDCRWVPPLDCTGGQKENHRVWDDARTNTAGTSGQYTGYGILAAAGSAVAGAGIGAFLWKTDCIEKTRRKCSKNNEETRELLPVTTTPIATPQERNPITNCCAALWSKQPAARVAPSVEVVVAPTSTPPAGLTA